jgi:hypothetical protein
MTQHTSQRGTDDKSNAPADGGPEDARTRGAIKDPKDWKTGDEPMTGAQESYLGTLARESGEEVKPELTKAEASEKIEELRHKTGRDETPPRQKVSGGDRSPQ